MHWPTIMPASPFISPCPVENSNPASLRYLSMAGISLGPWGEWMPTPVISVYVLREGQATQ